MMRLSWFIVILLGLITLYQPQLAMADEDAVTDLVNTFEDKFEPVTIDELHAETMDLFGTTCEVIPWRMAHNVYECSTKLITAVVDIFMKNIVDRVQEVVSLILVVFVMLMGFRAIFGQVQQGIFTQKLVHLLIVIAVVSNYDLLVELKTYAVETSVTYGSVVGEAINAGVSLTDKEAVGGTVASSSQDEQSCNRNIFTQMDCVALELMGFTINGNFDRFDDALQLDPKNKDTMIHSVIPFIMGSASTMQSGPIILVLALLAIVTLITAMIHALFVYVAAFFGISFLIALTPIMAPLILFEKTKKSVTQWAEAILAYAFQPVLLTAALVMTINLLEVVRSLNGNVFDEVKQYMLTSKNPDSSPLYKYYFHSGSGMVYAKSAYMSLEIMQDCTKHQLVFPAKSSDISASVNTYTSFDKIRGEGAQAEQDLGVDIAVRDGRPIFAAGAGTIEKVVNNCSEGGEECNNNCGNEVVINHGSVNGLETRTRYCTIGTVVESLASGQEIKKGHKLGVAGMSGSSQFPHLHFETIVDDNGTPKSIDPAKLPCSSEGIFSSQYSSTISELGSPAGAFKTTGLKELGDVVTRFKYAALDIEDVVKDELIRFLIVQFVLLWMMATVIKKLDQVVLRMVGAGQYSQLPVLSRSKMVNRVDESVFN